MLELLCVEPPTERKATCWLHRPVSRKAVQKPGTDWDSKRLCGGVRLALDVHALSILINEWMNQFNWYFCGMGPGHILQSLERTRCPCLEQTAHVPWILFPTRNSGLFWLVFVFVFIYNEKKHHAQEEKPHTCIYWIWFFLLVLAQVNPVCSGCSV